MAVTQVAAEQKAKFQELTRWELLPGAAKATLILANVVMISSCYIVQLFSSYCFEPYWVNNTIKEDLDGDWSNLIKPMGQVAMILFLISCFLLFAFSKWAGSKAAGAATSDV